MLADLTAFISLVFGYFFFWTIHDDFPPQPSPGPSVFWPTLGGGMLLAAWALTVLARRWNRSHNSAAFYLSLLISIALAIAGSAALVAGPWQTGMDPKSHVYPATVWLLVLWTVCHVAVGIIMQTYCLARRWAGRMRARHDVEIVNTTLYWHFTALTASITVAVIAGFPLVN